MILYLMILKTSHTSVHGKWNAPHDTRFRGPLHFGGCPTPNNLAIYCVSKKL